MKTKQEQDFQAVKDYIAENPGITTRSAIAEIAARHNKSAASVQVGYYKMLRREKGVAAPKKTKSGKPAKKTVAANGNLNLNLIRASLNDALKTIDALEAENKRNREIVDGLRKALTTV